MTENRRQILDMLSQGKITVDEAERLMAVVDQPEGAEAGRSGSSKSRQSSAKYLRVVVGSDSEDGSESDADRVNIRIPLALIKAGVRLAALLPADTTKKVNEAMEKQGLGLDLRNLKPEDLDQLVDALAELEVDVHDGKQKVRVYVE